MSTAFLLDYLLRDHVPAVCRQNGKKVSQTALTAQPASTATQDLRSEQEASTSHLAWQSGTGRLQEALETGQHRAKGW